MKLEGSLFNGREPDENRYNFDPLRLDSYGGRLSWNPRPDLALQVSHGFIKEPEALEPGVNVHRTTASLIYNRLLGSDANWTYSVVWGQNNDSDVGKANSYLAETDYQRGANTLYARLEQVEKSGRELSLAAADLGRLFNVGAYSVGYIRDLRHRDGSGIDAGLGVQITVNGKPSSLNPYYGSGTPVSFEIFFRFRPSGMPGASVGNMTTMASGHGRMSNTSRPISPEGSSASSSPAEEIAPGLVMTAAVTPSPPRVGRQNTVTVTLTDGSGKPVIGARVRASVDMTRMNMGTEHAVFRNAGSGRYRGKVAFSMAGPWRIRLSITPPQGQAPITRDLEYDVRP